MGATRGGLFVLCEILPNSVRIAHVFGWTGAELKAVLKGAATLDGEWKAVGAATAAERAARVPNGRDKHGVRDREGR